MENTKEERTLISEKLAECQTLPNGSQPSQLKEKIFQLRPCLGRDKCLGCKISLALP